MTCTDPRSPVDLVNELMIIWESGESDRLAELMSTDVVYDGKANRVSLQGATLIHVENGKIVRAADYLDALGFVLQLGSEVILPGDVLLKLPE